MNKLITANTLASVIATIVTEGLAPAPATASQERTRLEGLGIEGPAADLLVRETSGPRHAYRVRYAFAMAYGWAIAHNEEDHEEVERLVKVGVDVLKVLEKDELPEKDGPVIRADAFLMKMEAMSLVETWAILQIDRHGVGGHADAEGAGSARHPGLDRCGKGRKAATDGPAWSGAIEAAAGWVQRVLSGWGVHNLRLAPGNDEGCRHTLGVAFQVDNEEKEGWLGVEALHPRWVASYTAAKLIKAAKDGVAAAGWAATYNRANRFLKALAFNPWAQKVWDEGTGRDRHLLLQQSEKQELGGGARLSQHDWLEGVTTPAALEWVTRFGGDWPSLVDVKLDSEESVQVPPFFVDWMAVSAADDHYTKVEDGVVEWGVELPPSAFGWGGAGGRLTVTVVIEHCVPVRVTRVGFVPNTITETT